MRFLKHIRSSVEGGYLPRPLNCAVPYNILYRAASYGECVQPQRNKTYRSYIAAKGLSLYMKYKTYRSDIAAKGLSLYMKYKTYRSYIAAKGLSLYMNGFIGNDFVPARLKC